MTSIRKKKHRQIVKNNKTRKYVTRSEQLFMSSLLHACPHIKKRRYRNIFKACKGSTQKLKVLLNGIYGKREVLKWQA